MTERYASSLYKPLLKMLNGIVLKSITIIIETLTYRKSIADKLISSSHGYHALTDGASQFIETLTCGILFKYSTIAEAFSSPGVSPAFHRQSPFGHQKFLYIKTFL